MRVLVVDDERKLAQVLASALQAEHYDVMVAATGEDGFFRANADALDLVVLDAVRFWRLGRLTKGGGGMEVMMGDLVLTQEEVNPVMSALLDNGLNVTALHNHFLLGGAAIFYTHVHGHGAASDLARKLKLALDLIGKGAARPASTRRAVRTSRQQAR